MEHEVSLLTPNCTPILEKNEASDNPKTHKLLKLSLPGMGLGREVWADRVEQFHSQTTMGFSLGKMESIQQTNSEDALKTI